MVSGYTAFSLAALTMLGQLAPASAAAENHVYSTAQTAAAGEEAHIPMFIENNTGFVSFNIYLSYDPDVLTPMSVSTEGSVLTGKGDVNDSIGGHLKNLPENTVQVTFTSSDYTNADADGLMFDLVCGISEEAQGSTAGKTTVKVSKGSDIIGIGDQAGILWDEASNAKSYDITVKDSEGNTVQTKTGITGLSYALDGFAKEGVYTVGITAINTAGKTEGVSADITVKPDVKVSFYDSIDAEGKDIKTIIETVSVHYGHNADLPKSPAHEGCTFSKWNGTYEVVTADSEVVAEYDCAYYTVKFIDSFTNTVLSTQRIRYNAAATAPEVTAPEGYIFTSWNKDFTNVKSDLSVSTVYKWADEDHSATVKIDKARKNITDKGYDVTATVTNRTDEIISGRLVAVLLSENGTILAKAECS